MDVSDIFIFIQTVVLIVTCVVIYWYTKETSRIREETNKQNAILGKQVQIMEKTLDFKLKKERGVIEPVFNVAGGSYNPKSANFKFINRGGPAKKVKFMPQGTFQMEVNPSNLINTEDKFSVKVDNLPEPLPEILYFEISYDNKLGESKTQTYSYYTEGGKFLEVDEIPEV